MAGRELSKGKQLEKELCWGYPNITRKAPEQREKAHEFVKSYIEFFGAYKTEREYMNYAEKLLLEAGYERFGPKKKYKAGDRVFSTNRSKAMATTVFGKKSIVEGVRINDAHIDSPHIDLRPNPFCESNNITLLKIHYYGGIKKCQRGTIPLVIHDVVVKKGDTTVEITIGEDPSDPILYIIDLLTHLAKQRIQRTLSEGLRTEELDIILDTTPYPDDSVKGLFRFKALRYLNGKYGITEHDFARAEIEFIPADKPRDIGFDRSLIGGYGQDDRVCAYTALRAQLNAVSPGYTTVTVLTDKEEIGSCSTTGSKSDLLYDYIYYLAQMEGADAEDVFAKSACLSADVNGTYDPTFADAFEVKNSSYLNRGMVLTKHTGSGGKFGVNDMSVGFIAKVIDIMDKNDVHWQIGELDKLDLGGGDTIAGDAARLNVDVVDLGATVLSMHSPFKVTSKLDNYNMYLVSKAFCLEA